MICTLFLMLCTFFSHSSPSMQNGCCCGSICFHFTFFTHDVQGLHWWPPFLLLTVFVTRPLARLNLNSFTKHWPLITFPCSQRRLVIVYCKMLLKELEKLWTIPQIQNSTAHITLHLCQCFIQLWIHWMQQKKSFVFLVILFSAISSRNEKSNG